ncbi:hypothetical protein EMN47_06635 [Prolixibacteraceae bacterium JC049]|nr:hypothetical protein [Prolixibacteraceae bacterium JC049]
MKVLYTLLVLCLIPILSKAQIDSVPVTTSTTHIHYETQTTEIPRHFTYKDLMYDMSFKGLRNLMIEIERDNPEVYKQMLPHYNLLEKKKKTFTTITTVSLAAAGTLMLSAVVFKKKNNFFEDDSMNEKEINSGLFVSGIVVGGIGGLIAWLSAPTRADIFTLINTNNRLNEKGKIKWQLGYNQRMNVPQVGLCYVF